MKKGTPSFKISYIRIMLDTNVEEKPVVFTYSMLATPEIPKNAAYKYPYFTTSLKYNDSFLSNLNVENRMKFFFNKTEFSKVLRLMINMQGNNIVDYKQNLELLTKAKEQGRDTEPIFSRQAKQENENEQHNILLLLKYLFPIHPNFNEYLKRTDYELLGKIQTNIFKLNKYDVINSVNYFGWMNKIGAVAREQGGSYLSIGKGGGPSVIKSVVWENDVVNHPVYSDFLKTYNAKMTDVENSSFEITKKREESEKTFVEKVEKYMEKELNVEKSETKFSFGPNTASTFLLPYYFNKDKAKIDKVGNDSKTPRDKPQKTELYEYGSNIIYNKIHNKWLDNLSQTSQSSSKSSEIRSSSQIIMKELDVFLYEILKYREAKINGDALPTKSLIACYTNLIKIVDENYTMKSKIGTLFDFGDGERAMNDLFMAAVDLKTIDKIENFVKNKELFNIDTPSEDEGFKLESEKRVISRLKNAYPQFAELSRVLVNTLKSVLPPDRKTSNTMLYKLLMKTKSGTWSAGGGQKVIEELYNRYIQKSDMDNSIEVAPYLYTGVDTIIGKRDNTEGDTKEQANEIYIKIDVINKSDYEKNEGCLPKDNDLKNHMQFLLQNKYPYPTINPNREYVMDGVSVPGEGEATDKNVKKPKRGGGRRYTKRRRAFRKYTRRNNGAKGV